ncbi:putative phosphoinositide phospholipase C [Helianthus debilis subsp. tardiflorus]
MEEYEYYTWLFFFKRKFKISKRKPLPEMIEVFNACTNNESQMSPDHFRRFLIEFQGDEDVTVDYAKQIMEKVLHQLRPDFARCCFSVDDFFNYLFLDKFNGPIDYKVCKISNNCYLCCLSNLISVLLFSLL